MRRQKPSAEGEARNGMMVIEETCWDAVPEHYRRLERALARLNQPPLPYDATLISISTWMGVLIAIPLMSSPSCVLPSH